MSHGVIITTPPSNGGGGSRVAETPHVRIEYFPSHDLSQAEQERLAEKVQRVSDKISRWSVGSAEE